MFKFFNFKSTREKVIPFEQQERKIEWNIRSINSVLPENYIKQQKIKF